MRTYTPRFIPTTRRPDAGIYVKTSGKPLWALLEEIDLGLKVYPATNHDVAVWKENELYWFQRLDERNGGTSLERGLKLSTEGLSYVHVMPKNRPASGMVVTAMTMQYATFVGLLGDWRELSARAVWSTQMTAERLAWRPAPFTL